MPSCQTLCRMCPSRTMCRRLCQFRWHTSPRHKPHTPRPSLSRRTCRSHTPGTTTRRLQWRTGPARSQHTPSHSACTRPRTGNPTDRTRQAKMSWPGNQCSSARPPSCTSPAGRPRRWSLVPPSCMSQPRKGHIQTRQTQSRNFRTDTRHMRCFRFPQNIRQGRTDCTMMSRPPKTYPSRTAHTRTGQSPGQTRRSGSPDTAGPSGSTSLLRRPRNRC
jgi:hypothetical protein